MWLLDGIAAVDNWIDRLIGNIFCKHEWVFERRIREQNLRGGYNHWSNLSNCKHCGRHKVEEVPQEQADA